MFTGKILLVSLFTFFSFHSPLSAAEDLNVDPLSNISVSKDEIIKSLEMLKKQGKITDADYQKAKKEIAVMTDAQVNGIKDIAVNMVRKDPDKAVELLNAKKIDLKQVEKQAVEVTP
ncbi:MAG: hypothetical protein H7177_10195 [Rhizobacter sp.]|nr:hypothetical protein [Bacteriovorax sp.]